MGTLSGCLDNSKRVSPVHAFLLVLAIFAVSSLIFNLVTLLLHWLGLARFLGGLFQGAAVIILFSFAMPIAFAAGKSRGSGRPVVLAAAAVLIALYFSALHWRFDLISHWLYPHWPGMPVDLSVDRAIRVLLVAVMLFGIAYWAVNDLREDHSQAPADPDAITELGEGVLEGVGNQLSRPSGGRGGDTGFWAD
jgi:MFS family permease